MSARKFWDRVRIPAGDGCWQWVAGKGSDGHGRFYAGGRHVPAHRFAYELLVGPIPEGLVIDHLCRNSACVNPAHMEPVTIRVNTLRGISPIALNPAKTHCPIGHPYSGDNLYVTPRGHRDCRTCRRAAGRRSRQKRSLSNVQS